ncbi:MAG: OmpA family protein [Pseudomonadota bacterium]
MLPKSRFAVLFSVVLSFGLAHSHAQDIAGAEDHPLVSRYPGQALRWQQLENHREFRVPIGRVTGYRAIGEWVDVEGRVTRTHYVYAGTDRSWTEIFLNYREALTDAGFELLAQGSSDSRGGPEVGSRQWLNVYLAANPPGTEGEVLAMASGTATQGGQGSLVATYERAAGRVYVVVTVEQHAADNVGTLIDVVELKAAQTGLVAVDPDAIGRDIDEQGRVVLHGLFFAFDSPELTPESRPALDAIATYLRERSDQSFYVVGHTDSRGTLEYNLRLSRQRADAVVDALLEDYGIGEDRLNGHGVGPLNPVFSNESENGRRANRRVELVERLE